MRRVSPRALLVLTSLLACSGPAPVGLEHAPLAHRYDWWDNRDWSWYEANAPFFESPDSALDETYWYRWELLTKHLTYGSPATGYTFTEFIDRPFWSGAYGAISCSLGHQLYEARWIRDPTIVQDFARYWFETPGAQPRTYSNWYGDAVWAAYSVLADTAFLHRMYPHMRAQVDGWTAEHWDDQHQMYRWVGAWDGMETNINSRLTDDAFGGAEGYRPTLNSYLWADLRALSRTAALFGDTAGAARYGDRADALKERIQSELWDPDRDFFFHQFAFDEKGGIRALTRTYESGPYEGDPHGRELMGYVPWEFGLPDAGYESAWRFLLDPAYFTAPHGLTTVEQGDPQFLISPDCCVWSGNSWPYATTQALVAMARLLHDYDQGVVSRADYMDLVDTYARSQRRGGRPYIAEALDPLTGSWDGHNAFYHSEHYFHSGFIDLVITGVVGLSPSPDDTLRVNPLARPEWSYFALDAVRYHGRDVSVLWDRDGNRYGKGAGLSLWANGQELGRRADLGPLSAPLPAGPVPEPPRRRNNWAVNNDGSHFPLATASSSDPRYAPFYAVDGARWYHPSPPNRWVAGNPSGEVTFEVDFGAARSLDEVTLYLLDDTDGPAREAVGDEDASGFPGRPGESALPVRSPEKIRVEMWTGGAWLEVPGMRGHDREPRGRTATHVSFPEVRTTRVRVVFWPRPGATVGLTELETWGPADADAPAPHEPIGNLAWNPTSEGYPRAVASYTWASERADQVIDGRIALTRYSRNRWTAYQSPNAEDWLEVDFGRAQRVSRVELFLLGDGRGVAPPASYRIEAWYAGGWHPVDESDRDPKNAMGWALNTVRFAPVVAERVRVVFVHAPPTFSGISEIRIWKE
jgi:hypothetical protein